MYPADCKVLYHFLIPDEEHLGRFSQMGFHIISCVEWMINAVNVYVHGCYLLSV